MNTRYMSECWERTKILTAYRGEIVELLERWPSITSAIIDDRLRENHANFKAHYQTVRMYASALRELLGIATEKAIRQYTEVTELAPGVQAQADMGQMLMKDMYNKSVRIYIFTME